MDLVLLIDLLHHNKLITMGVPSVLWPMGTNVLIYEQKPPYFPANAILSTHSLFFASTLTVKILNK